jgi:hypothetical protein
MSSHSSSSSGAGNGSQSSGGNGLTPAYIADQQNLLTSLLQCRPADPLQFAQRFISSYLDNEESNILQAFIMLRYCVTDITLFQVFFVHGVETLLIALLQNTQSQLNISSTNRTLY